MAILQTFFKMTQYYLSSTLCSVYVVMWQGRPHLPTGSQALIKLIPKEGKDPTLPGNRLISLINVDVIILSKIVATCIATLLPAIIHLAQAGFICPPWLYLRTH